MAKPFAHGYYHDRQRVVQYTKGCINDIPKCPSLVSLINLINSQLTQEKLEKELYSEYRKTGNKAYYEKLGKKKKFNKTGYTGVSYSKHKKKYVARIGILDQKITIGYFDTALEASNAYEEAKRKKMSKHVRINK